MADKLTEEIFCVDSMVRGFHNNIYKEFRDFLVLCSQAIFCASHLLMHQNMLIRTGYVRLEIG